MNITFFVLVVIVAIAAVAVATTIKPQEILVIIN